jgi:hypothetical protein
VTQERAKAEAVERAKKFILAHPDQSKLQQAVGCGVSQMSVARARAELIRDGLLPASRKAYAPSEGAPAPTKAPLAEPLAVAPAPTGDSLDMQAMMAMSTIVDLSDEEDDAVTHRRLLKQCLIFAFDTRLHADTRMSASTLWQKLKDQTKARELGPGAPKTRAEAVRRMGEMMVAVGPEITLEAVSSVFSVAPPPEAPSDVDTP